MTQLYQVSQFYLNANEKYLLALKECLNRQIDDHATAAVSASNAQSEIQIVQSFLTLNGVKTSETELCQTFVTKWTKELSRSYQEMRRGLILSSPTRKEGNPLLTQLIDSEPIYKINLSPEHKNFASFTETLKMAKLNPASETEKAYYIDAYNQFTSEKCTEFVENNNRKISEFRFNFELCPYLNYRDWSHLKKLSSEDDTNVKSIQKLFTTWLYGQREAQREEYLTEYHQKVNLNPVLLYLTSKPSLKQLADAVDKTYQNQLKFTQTEKSSTSKISAGIALNFNLKQIKNIPLPEQEELYFELKEHFKKTKFTVNIASYLKQNEPLIDWLNVKNEVDSTIQSELSRSIKVSIGLLIGANLLCIAAPGGIFKFARAALVRSICNFGFGLPLNTYFVVSSHYETQDALLKMMLSTHQRYSLSNLTEADSKRGSLYSALLFWPLGLGLKDARQLMKVIP